MIITNGTESRGEDQDGTGRMERGDDREREQRGWREGELTKHTYLKFLIFSGTHEKNEEL